MGTVTPLTSLPYDVLILITGNCDSYRTLHALRQTCRLFANIYQQPYARKLLLQRGIVSPPLSPPLRLLQAAASTNLVPRLPHPCPPPPALAPPLRLTSIHLTFLRAAKKHIHQALPLLRLSSADKTKEIPRAHVRAAWHYLFALLAPRAAERELSMRELWAIWFLQKVIERQRRCLGRLPWWVNGNTDSYMDACDRMGEFDGLAAVLRRFHGLCDDIILAHRKGKGKGKGEDEGHEGEEAFTARMVNEYSLRKRLVELVREGLTIITHLTNQVVLRHATNRGVNRKEIRYILPPDVTPELGSLNSTNATICESPGATSSLHHMARWFKLAIAQARRNFPPDCGLVELLEMMPRVFDAALLNGKRAVEEMDEELKAELLNLTV